MLARFIWAGNGKATSAHQAFSQPSNWREYGPLIKWDFNSSTAKHSAEATVWIPQHAGIQPAGNQLSNYGFASINAGDHVFLQDMESALGTGFPIPGWPILQGTVDKVEYEDQMMKIHFRNPLSWLADNYVKEGPVVPFINYAINGFSFTFPLLQVGSDFKYVPNYSLPIVPPPNQIRIIKDFIAALATDYVGGPFVSTVNVDPSAVNDGSVFQPNYTNNNKVTLLSSILKLCAETRWSDGQGYGLEILANPIPSGAGFSTELYVFRRGALNSGYTFDYHGAGTHAIIDYNFPEQTLDVPTSGNAVGSGGLRLDPREFAGKIQTINPLLNAFLNNLIYRGVAGLESSGRNLNSHEPYVTTKDNLYDSILGKLDGIGLTRGLRVGSVRVGGWLGGPILPGFYATVNIPETGLVSEHFIIDEVQYSEPDGITTIYFNRESGDSLARQLKDVKQQLGETTGASVHMYDSGWFRADGSAGVFDTVASPDAPQVNKPSLVFSTDRISVIHNLGKQPNVVEIWAGLLNNPQTDVEPLSRSRVMELAYDPTQDQWYGASIVGNYSDATQIAFAQWVAFNQFIEDTFLASQGPGRGWYNMTYTNLYLRIICKP